MKILLTIACLFFFSSAATADDQAKKTKSSDFVTTDKTYIDFSETSIDGSMKAPTGFFIQGRQSQSLQQMVRLRSKWRGELRNSKAAVKSLVK
jgi:hypothetical protein